LREKAPAFLPILTNSNATGHTERVGEH
jgi:hypothetical protein